MVGDDLDARRPDRERQGVGQVAVVLDGDQPVSGLDRAARELADHAADELVVPAVDVPLLVRAVERRRRLRLERLAVAAVVVRQDVDEVERRLLLRRAAVLADDHVVAQLPERRAEPARDVLLDPVDDRQVIPVVAGLGEPRVARRPRRLADGVVEGGPGIGLPIGIEHRLGVARAVEPIRVERAGWVGGGGRGEVERQAQAAGEAQRLDVLRRDELTVLLDDLVVGEIAAQGVDAAPDAGVPLVDRRGLLPLRPEPVGAAQAGDTATDDRDPRLGRRANGAGCGEARGRRTDTDGGPGLEQRAPAQAAIGGRGAGFERAFGAHRGDLVDGNAGRRRLGRGSVGLAEHRGQWSVQRACHGVSPSSGSGRRDATIPARARTIRWPSGRTLGEAVAQEEDRQVVSAKRNHPGSP